MRDHNLKLMPGSNARYPEAVSAHCKHGEHYRCSKLKCTCTCHRRRIG